MHAIWFYRNAKCRIQRWRKQTKCISPIPRGVFSAKTHALNPHWVTRKTLTRNNKSLLNVVPIHFFKWCEWSCTWFFPRIFLDFYHCIHTSSISQFIVFSARSHTHIAYRFEIDFTVVRLCNCGSRTTNRFDRSKKCTKFCCCRLHSELMVWNAFIHTMLL